MARWKSLSVEQIAVSVTLAHAAGIDKRLLRLVFTTDIKTRNELHQELKAFSFDARQSQHSSDNSSAPQGKRVRAMSHITCHNCGKPGHKKAECRFNKETTQRQQPRNQQSGLIGAKDRSSVICYKCGKAVHVSTVCLDRQERPPTKSNTNKDVNTCTVLEPLGTLLQFLVDTCFISYCFSILSCEADISFCQRSLVVGMSETDSVRHNSPHCSCVLEGENELKRIQHEL